jgi:hypothetical protein
MLAAGLAGFVMASPWGHAAEQPAHPIAATPEIMQLLRDEHDLAAEMIKAQLAAERDQIPQKRAAGSATSNAIGMAVAPPPTDRASSSAPGRRRS